MKKENEYLKKQLENLNLIQDEEIKKLNEKCKILNEEKEKIIDSLIIKLNSNTALLKNINLPKGEKLITIRFISVDQHIDYSIICNNKTRFSEIESELYAKYPEYLETSNFFICNGCKVEESKTLEENGINGYTIMLKTIDNDE